MAAAVTFLSAEDSSAWQKSPLYLQNFTSKRVDMEEGQDNTELKEPDGPTLVMR